MGWREGAGEDGVAEVAELLGGGFGGGAVGFELNQEKVEERSGKLESIGRVATGMTTRMGLALLFGGHLRGHLPSDH